MNNSKKEENSHVQLVKILLVGYELVKTCVKNEYHEKQILKDEMTFDTNAHSNKITRKGQYTVKRVVILNIERNYGLMS